MFQNALDSGRNGKNESRMLPSQNTNKASRNRHENEGNHSPLLG